jgi:hypothetical protein
MVASGTLAAPFLALYEHFETHNSSISPARHRLCFSSLCLKSVLKTLAFPAVARSVNQHEVLPN